MSMFSYTALDRAGKRTTGTIPAETRWAAMDRVMGMGLSPVSLEEQRAKLSYEPKPGRAAPTRVPQSAVESFTRELANLLGAGLPLSRALHLLRRETSHAGAKNVWSHVHDDVVGGMPLADALAKWPKAFSTVYVAMIRAGEAGGFLDVVLQQIADFRTRDRDLKGKVIAAMIYPAVLMFLAILAVIFLLTFFIPRFSTIFAEFGSQLPMLTRIIITVSGWLTRYGWVVAIIFIAGLFGFRHMVTTASGRRFRDRAILRAPLIGKVAARFALVRFCRMLGTLVGGGVSLVASLRVAKEALGNQTLSDAVAHAIEEVQRGTPLSRSLASNTLLFPPSVIEMISVAEETGRLDKELVRLSVAYESDLDRNLRMLVSVAEPLLLMLMAGFIGTIIIGMLLPVFTIQELIK